MLKIGEFSKISQVPVKTLRYYDEVGLLKPVEVDRFTGYRYYAFHQLKRLHRILALKDLGFSLDEIARLLSDDLPVAELRGMLHLKQAELRRRVQSETEQLERVEIRLKLLEKEDMMSDYDVVLKKVEPVLIASVRGVVPTYPEQGPLWEKLGTALQQRGVPLKGPCFTLYHSQEPDVDTEVCEPLTAPVSVGEPVKVYELPGEELVASVVHHGPFTTIGEAYGAVMMWIQNNGYHISGPEREIYLKEATPMGSQNDPNTVTEIQFPVEKD